MTNSFFYYTKLSDFRPVLWPGGHVFKQYSLIKNHLRINLGPAYADLLSNPVISDQDLIEGKMVSWTSEVLSDKSESFSDLSADVKEKVTDILESRLKSVHAYINFLRNTNDFDNQKWADLIEKSFHIPSLSFLMVDGENISLVLWGFENVQHNSKQINTLNVFAKKFNPSDFIIKKSLTADSSNIQLEEIVGATNPIDVRTKQASIANQEEIKPSTTAYQTTTFPNPLESAVVSSTTRNRTAFVNAGYDYKKGLWLLFFLFITFLIIFIVSQHQQTISYLPSQAAIIVPIDTNKIIQDPQGNAAIVSDRINIALLGKNKNLVAFSRNFKEKYKSDNYKIIYYDTNIHRLQIQVPKEERESIKNDIENNMTGFELLVWNETIFGNNRSFNDPIFNNFNQWWYLKAINADVAWDKTEGNPSIIIAIIDDGFDLSNPDFAGKIFKPRNITEGNNQVTVSKVSPHGTHVAGTALASSNNNFGSTGIAPNCKFMPVQVGDQNGLISQTSIVDGILYAINNGASVINLSMGTLMLGEHSDNVDQNQQEDAIQTSYKSEEKFWNLLFKEAYDKNVTIVQAGGNDNMLIGIDPFQRSPYTIKVSAVDPDISKASFSNYGKYSTISAPGVGIYNDAPNAQMAYLDGTSMASPIVAGGVALIKSIHPAYSFEQIVEVLKSTGLPINSPGYYIGNLIQLDKALDVVRNDRLEEPKASCADIQKKIDSLTLLIKRLQNSCKYNENEINLIDSSKSTARKRLVSVLYWKHLCFPFHYNPTCSKFFNLIDDFCCLSNLFNIEENEGKMNLKKPILFNV